MALCVQDLSCLLLVGFLWKDAHVQAYLPPSRSQQKGCSTTIEIEDQSTDVGGILYKAEEEIVD